MKKYRITDMLGGWFVGDFDPNILKTKDFEVGVKIYEAGDKEDRHYHKEAVEITMILDGDVVMNGTKYTAGDIIVIDKNESTDFESFTSSRTLVVKIPSVIGDKYLGDPSDFNIA